MHDFRAVSAYWDDELPEPEKSRLADHLADCLLCQGWLRSLAVLTRTLALFPHAPMPADFSERISAILTCPEPDALSGAADATLSAHLEICAPCRSRREGPADLGSAMRQLPGYQPKADFLSRLMAKLPVCPSFEDLSAYVDGEVSAEQITEIREHLPTCGPCSHRIEQLQALTGSIHALPTPAAPSLTSVVLELGDCPSHADLSAWLDGELTTAALPTHIDQCTECAQVVRQWQWLGRGMQTLPVPAPKTVTVCPNPAELVAEGELPTEIADHVAACSSCAERLTRWEQLGRLMREVPAAPVSVGFAERVVAQLKDCPDRLVLHAFHDGELSLTERAALQSHLIDCAECQRVLTAFTRVSMAVAALPSHDAPTGFAFGVAARLPKQQKPVETLGAGRRGWQWPTAMAAGVLVAGLIMYLQGNGTTPETKSTVATLPQHQREELVAVQVRSEDLLVGEQANLNNSPSLLDEWSQ